MLNTYELIRKPLYHCLFHPISLSCPYHPATRCFPVARVSQKFSARMVAERRANPFPRWLNMASLQRNPSMQGTNHNQQGLLFHFFPTKNMWLWDHSSDWWPNGMFWWPNSCYINRNWRLPGCHLAEDGTLLERWPTRRSNFVCPKPFKTLKRFFSW